MTTSDKEAPDLDMGKSGEVDKGEESQSTSQGDVDTEEKIDDEEDTREQWGSQLEFILTVVGYAVGLGNVWRFPYLCFKNGGGAFLIPYFIMMALCGMPLFYFEVCFGQFASLGPLKIWSVNPLFKGIGLAMVTVSTFVGLYYNILVAYIIYYFFASMTSVLPWTDCDNSWNTYQCMTADEMANKTYVDYYLEEYNMTNEDIRTPSEEYFYNQVLKLSPGIDQMGSLVWTLVGSLFLAWGVVFLVLLKGIASLGKVVYFTSTFPYVMMLIMVVRGCMLPGAGTGIEFYLKPDWNKLADAEVWSDAAVQIFYSLSTCSGGLIAMASYNKFNNNAYRDSIMVPLINCGTSIFAGFAVFSVLGFLAVLKGVDVADVAQSGPGLIFVVYPEGLSQMPVAPLWSFFFFFMMLTLGFSSQFSIVECVYTALLDVFPVISQVKWGPILLRGIGCSLFFLLSLPMVCEGGFYLFNIMDTYAGGFPRLFTGIFELIAVIWIYGLNKFLCDVELMVGKKPDWFYRSCWTVVTPVLVIVIVAFKAVQQTGLTLFNGEYVYPDWANVLGWLMVAAVVVWIPAWWVIQWLIDGGYTLMKASGSPTDNWGPAREKDRTGKYAPDETEMVVRAPRGGAYTYKSDLWLSSTSPSPGSFGVTDSTTIETYVGNSNTAFEGAD